MPKTYYDSELTAEQIEDALTAIDGVVNPGNNGKVLYIENGQIKAASASRWSGSAVLEPLSVTANGDYTPPTGTDGFDSVHVAVPSATLTTKSITANGTYNASSDNADGYSSVTVAVPGGATIEPLSVTQNGTYNPPSGVDGYAPVTVNVSGGGGSDILDLCSPEVFIYSQKSGKAPNLNVYPGDGIGQRTFDYVGNEYSGYVYGTNIIDDCGLVLLADLSQNSSSTSANLSDSIDNYSGVVLQGIYNKQRTSSYNTTMLYVAPKLNKSYWAGMKDRNSSYTCNVTFTSETTITLSGNKQVIIYGIP